MVSLLYMVEAVVRVAQGFFDDQMIDRVIAGLEESRGTLEPALKALHGILHFYAAVDRKSNSMVNISVWSSLEDAKQMDKLPEMLALRKVFEALGVRFEPNRNYSTLWNLS
jgi:hypothetical protein